MLTRERGELTQLEQDVVQSLADHEILAENIEAEFDQTRTFGERMSDRLASFGGSWTFIGLFFAILVVWMAFNIVVAAQAQFDPYPFILLNLVLSCLAAIQAPIIMMSQKRQEAKDRLRSENDYRVNLKAELEIRHLHEKIDHMLTRQWERLAEMQQLQLEIMQELAVRPRYRTGRWDHLRLPARRTPSRSAATFLHLLGEERGVLLPRPRLRREAELRHARRQLRRC